MLTSRLGRVIAGKVGYAAACLLAAVVLVVAGYAHKVVGYASGFNSGVDTGNAPSNSTQAMNILVMGLESRTNFYGQPLPPALITATSARIFKNASTVIGPTSTPSRG